MSQPDTRQLQLIETAVLARNEDPAEAGAISFFHPACLVLATLPYQQISGNLEVQLENGAHVSIDGTRHWGGLPYGAMPRLLLAKILTKAVQERRSSFQFAENIWDLYRQLDLQAPDTRAAIRAREQLIRLLGTAWKVTSPGGDFQVLNFLSRVRSPAPGRRSDTPVSRSKGGVLTPSFSEGVHVTLAEDFFQDLLEHAVPIDYRAARALRHPMSLDLYFLAAYRAWTVKPGSGLRMPFVSLMRAWGTALDPTNKRHRSRFQTRLKISVSEVLTVYPGLRMSLVPGKLVIKRSDPHVKRRQITV